MPSLPLLVNRALLETRICMSHFKVQTHLLMVATRRNPGSYSCRVYYPDARGGDHVYRVLPRLEPTIRRASRKPNTSDGGQMV